jgi:hypothetical protein
MVRLAGVVALVAAAVGVLGAAPVPKENDQARMMRVYGTVHDPDKGTEFIPVGETLRLLVSREMRQLSAWDRVFNAPRVWREVRGDFTVTVRASFHIRSEVPARHERVKEGRACGGLVAWADSDQFLTLTRDERAIDNKLAEFFRVELLDKGSAYTRAEQTAVDGAGYLRLQRDGKTMTGRFSRDGKKWNDVWSTEVEWGDALKVGVVAENTFKAPFEVVFDHYTLTGAK